MRPSWFSTTPEEEARGLDRADVVLAIQPSEASQLAARTRAPVRLLEYACKPREPVHRPPADTPIVGYFGSANPWNVASLAAFDTLVAGRRDLDRVRFLRLGGISDAAGPWHRFQAAGRVSDVADVYDAVDAIVNPMVGGTGLKIKSVEALAHGRALFSTRDGGVGLEAFGPDLVLPGLSALADRLAQVLASPGAVAAIAAEQGRRYTPFHEAVSARLDAMVDEWARGGIAGDEEETIRHSYQCSKLE